MAAESAEADEDDSLSAAVAAFDRVLRFFAGETVAEAFRLGAMGMWQGRR